MRTTTFISVLGLTGGALGTICSQDCPVATIDECNVGTSNICLAPDVPLKKRAHAGIFSSTILRRTCTDCPPGECPEDRKKCTPGGRKPPQLPVTVKPFLCGQKVTDKSVTATYIDCPADPTKKCLVLTISAGLEAPKLEISSKPLTSSTPGRFSYYKPVNYCTANTCTVPIDVILAREGKTAADLCDLTLYLTLHSGLGDDTCWPEGTKINDKTSNWAREFPITFECPTYPEKCCCCPPPPPVLPPKNCGSETAYASVAPFTFKLSDLDCTKAWGYYQKVPAATVGAVPVGGVVYTADLLAGQTNNVGVAVVTKSSASPTNTCFTVTLDPSAGYGAGLAHIDIACVNPKANLGDKCRAPGKYEFNSGCFTVNPYTTTAEICTGTACGSDYYFLIHAETYSIVQYDAANPKPYDECKPYICGSAI